MSFYIPALVAILAIAWVVQKLLARVPPKLDYPVVGSPGDPELGTAILEGSKKYPDTPWILPTSPPQLMLPMSLYPEAMAQPEHVISFGAENHERFLGRYTHIGEPRPEVVQTVRSDLTKSIAQILPLFHDEVRYGFDKELGAAEDWTPVPLYAKLLRMVALLSGRVFVGRELSRDEAWLDASIRFTTDIMAVFRDSQSWNPVLRPLVAPFLGSVRRTRGDMRRAQRWMAPLVRDMLGGGGGGDPPRDDAEKGRAVAAGSRGTFISWLLGYTPEARRNAQRIGEDQLLISFAAIHTTTSTATHVLFDLAARPEYIRELREELEAVLAEDGEELDEHGSPYIRKASYAKLRKLDSFIKESQRYNMLGLSLGTRRLMRDYTFQNGLCLPKGTRISFPSYGVHMSSNTPTFSPEYNAEAGNPGPEVFDGFRFSKLRDVPGRETKHQSVTTSMDSLSFGHGPHACPGRFFAIYEIKAIVIEFLRHWDFRLAGDVDGLGGPDRRPPNLRYGTTNAPNPRASIEVRRRREAGA